MTETAIQRAPTGMELLAELSRKNSDPQAAIEIAKQIVELQVKQESLRQSQDRFEWEKQERIARIAFAESFKKFKEDAPKILKTKHVYFEKKNAAPGDKPTSYWHVELDKACDLLIPALLKVGITHRWKSSDLPGGMTRVTCFLRHQLGYEEEGASLAGPSDQSGGKNPIQGVGSSTLYLERYTFLATCGIVPTGMDDDGNPAGITQEEGGTYVSAIQGAETAIDVMAAWTKAIDAAKKFTPVDYRSMTIFTEARDERLLAIKRSR
jgi:hypothetical protein